MADIDIQKKRGPGIWPWILGLILLAALLWWLFSRRGNDEATTVKTDSTTVVTDTAPIAAPVAPVDTTAAGATTAPADTAVKADTTKR